MKTPSEAYWVGLVAFTIAGLCVAAIAVIAVREKRRTGHLPPEMIPRPGGSGWFAVVWWVWMFLRWQISAGLVKTFPLFVIVPGIDLGLGLAFVAFAGWAMSYAFRNEWSRRTGLWIIYCLVFPSLSLFVLSQDIKCLESMAWAWVPAGIVGIALAPFAARAAYMEFYLSRLPEPPEAPRPRIYRPGEPTA